MYAGQRTLRLADGPDEVHCRTIARDEFGKYGDLRMQKKNDADKALEVAGIR
jgi:acyl-CoA dehydrogenase